MIIDKLKRLQELEFTLKSLKNEITDNSKPILTDLSLLSKIKEIIKSEYRKNAFSWRDYFIVVSLFLYYPRGLMGDRLPKDLKNIIDNQIGINSDVINGSKLLRAIESKQREFKKGFKDILDGVINQGVICDTYQSKDYRVLKKYLQYAFDKADVVLPHNAQVFIPHGNSADDIIINKLVLNEYYLIELAKLINPNFDYWSNLTEIKKICDSWTTYYSNDSRFTSENMRIKHIMFSQNSLIKFIYFVKGGKNG